MHYIVLVDTSYSMIMNLDKLVTGLNNFIQTIRNSDTHLSIVNFSNNMKYIYKGTNIKDVGNIIQSDLSGFSSTSLYDSVCNLIIEWKVVPGLHKLFIITDGIDNSSRRYNKEQTNFLCNEATLSGNWEIVHCHTEVSDLCVSKKVVYEVDNLSDILGNLII